MSKKDLVIIGGGAGGLGVTSGAAQLGLDVALIEKSDKLGGDCLHYGCVPSKTLIHAANVAHEMRTADQLGLEAVSPSINLAQVNQHVANVINHIQEHDDPDRFRSYGAQVEFGMPKFLDPNTIEVNGQKIKSKRFVLAMGSSPAIPPIKGLQEAGFVTNETIFQLQQLPKSMVVLGAGAIGLEMALAFARFGTKVTVVEMLDSILAQMDSELTSLLQSQLEKEGVTFYLGYKVTAVTEQKAVIAENKAGNTIQVDADEILVATGRKANVEGLDLDKAGVEYSARGVSVDARLRSNQKHIYAMGDMVDGPFKFTHMAEYHAGIVIANTAFRLPKKANYRVVPAVVYTQPEVAVVGLTEQQAKAQYGKIDVMRFEFKDVDRAITDVATVGMTKVIAHKGKIVGAHILGPQAGELIAELALAMQANLKIGQISATIHAYPTLAQVNRRVVNTYYGPKLFSPKVRNIVKWINRIVP